ncbi:hypothetical protein NESM_000263100 [Novymonas esmeraldas]|uniref:Uncharacterized protein n=1 Tax=Novymonas esmeraldas TaxID=1808958 RepID=A0AAW0F8W1_9TRYP
MTKTYLTEEQVRRAEHLAFLHKSLSSLGDATAEAIKYHDKYVAALDKMVGLLLDNSDALEEIRRLFGGAGIEPTFEVTGQLSTSFTTWKESRELLHIREDLLGLSDTSAVAKRNVKMTEKTCASLEAAQKQCAKLSSPSQQRKMERSVPRQQRLLREKKENTLTLKAELDHAVSESMRSLSAWWAKKLASLSCTLTTDFAKLGELTSKCYAPPPPPPNPASGPQHPQQQVASAPPTHTAPPVPAQSHHEAGRRASQLTDASDSTYYGSGAYIDPTSVTLETTPNATAVSSIRRDRHRDLSAATAAPQSAASPAPPPPLFGNLVAASADNGEAGPRDGSRRRESRNGGG